MTSISQIIYFIVVFGYAFAGEGDRTDDHVKIYRTQFPLANNGIMGVASIAEFMSRNGRLSSAGGIHFFSPMNQPIPSTQNMESFKKAEGNMATAIIKLYPEYSKSDDIASFMKIYPSTVAVASVSSQPNRRQSLGPYRLDSMSWPINGISASNNILSKGNTENWSHRDIYNNLVPSTKSFRNVWHIPIFDPFLNYY